MREPPATVPAADRWDRPDLATAIRQVLARTGLDRGPVTVDQLAPLDQFHAGGIGFTRRLAALGGLRAGLRVLDVGGGLGGPARTLAAEQSDHPGAGHGHGASCGDRPRRPPQRG